jgi:hypothetical protein
MEGVARAHGKDVGQPQHHLPAGSRPAGLQESPHRQPSLHRERSAMMAVITASIACADRVPIVADEAGARGSAEGVGEGRDRHDYRRRPAPALTRALRPYTGVNGVRVPGRHWLVRAHRPR